MKKVLENLRAWLLMVAFMMCAMIAMAQEVEIDGVMYALVNDEAFLMIKISPSSQAMPISDYSGDFVIPSTVTYEGKTYPVTHIQPGAFRYSSVTSVYIPNSVRSIGGEAFYGCVKMNTIVIPASVTEMGSGDTGCFYFCETLQSMTVEEGNPIYDSREGCNAIIETASNTLIAGCVNTTVPASVTGIGPWAFKGCTGLKSFTIPNTVQTIGVLNPFDECLGLTQLTVDMETIPTEAFSNTPLVEQLTIGNHVQNISDRAFKGCSKLTSLSLGNSVVTIGEEAFAATGCFGTLNIPGTVKQIGNRAFLNTPVSEVLFQHGKEQLDALLWTPYGTDNFKGPQGTMLTFSDDVASQTTIGYFLSRSDAFRYWAEANADCFVGIIGFTTAYVENTYKVGRITYRQWIPINGIVNGSEIGFYGTLGKPCLSGSYGGTVDLRDIRSNSDGTGTQYAMTEAGNYAFDGIRDELLLPSTIKTVGEWAFKNCTGLKVFDFSMLTSLEDAAFYGCTSLKTVNFGDQLTAIGNGTFNGCTSLETVYWGPSIKNVEHGAFSGCTGLKTVNGGDLDAWLDVDFADEKANPLYYAPYFYCKGIKNGNLKIVNTNTVVKNYAFVNYNGFKTVVLGPQVSSIGYNAFSGCGSETLVVVMGDEPLTLTMTSDVHLMVQNGMTDYYRKNFQRLSTFETIPIRLVAENDGNVTSIRFTFHPYDEEHNYGDKVGDGEAFVYGLDPNMTHKDLPVAWTTPDGNHGVFLADATTSELTFETLPASAISNTKAMISAKTNFDDDLLRCGFEWRRYDAPDLVPSTLSPCPVYDGELIGTLNGLSANVYYKFRPYYKSDAGNMYYGEWSAFGTADAYVYFEPVVHTSEPQTGVGTTVTLSAVVVAGSDDIVEQGFEYWVSESSAGAMRHAPQDVQRVLATGQRMTVVLTDLQLGVAYTYRAFVTTAKETTYSEEQSFSIDASTGIDMPTVDGTNVRQTSFNVYTLSGMLVRSHADTLEGLPRGLYLINRRKVFVR